MGSFIFTLIILLAIVGIIVFITTVVIPGFPDFVDNIRAQMIKEGQIYYFGYLNDNPFSEGHKVSMAKVIEVKKGIRSRQKYVRYVDLASNQEFNESAIDFVKHRTLYKDEKRKTKKSKA